MKNDQDYSLELDIEEIMKITDKKLLQKMIQQSVERNMQLKDTQIKNHPFQKQRRTNTTSVTTGIKAIGTTTKT